MQAQEHANKDPKKNYNLDETYRPPERGFPITYQYLTFDTILPETADDAASESPECPSLEKYVSPFSWSSSRKSGTTWLSCGVTMVTAYTAGSYSPPVDQMAEQWHVSHAATLVGITMFTTGFAVAPLFLAPCSELNGRRPVFIASGILFVIGQLCCAVTRTYPGMLIARFFTGVGGSTFSTMVGGVVSDIYHKEDRNTPMAIFAGGALFGTGLGPLCSALIAQRASWRWVFYAQVITSATVILLVAIFFKETRGSVLLSRRARLLNSWYEAREQAGLVGIMVTDAEPGQVQRIRWKVKSDEERETLAKMIMISVYRPFHLLITEPVVFFFSLWVAFSWAVLYLMFSSVPLVFSTNHHFNIEQNGAVFAAMCVGALVATVLSIYQEKLAKRFCKLSSTPEERLYFSCIESALMPIGLFWFGWTSFPSIHWIVPTLAVGCATMGIFSVYLAVFNYLADTYHCYASSALAAQSFARNILGGVFPVITGAMYKNMGFAASSSLLGGIGALLTCVPWVLVFYGPRIRARSKFASGLTDVEH